MLKCTTGGVLTSRNLSVKSEGTRPQTLGNLLPPDDNNMKSITSMVLALAGGASAYASGATERPTAAGAASSSSSRRTFVTQAVGFAGASFLGWLSSGTQCNLAGQHGPGCKCVSCGAAASFGLRPPSANAYERDVGGKDRSADTAALNLQAKETNARLEKSGFKLDTKEEEEARLSSALSSFSYDSNSAAGKSATRKSYGGKASGAPLKQGTSGGR